VDVAATDVIARLLRGEDHAHRNAMSVASSDDSNGSSSPLPASSSPGTVTSCMPARLTPGTDAS